MLDIQASESPSALEPIALSYDDPAPAGKQQPAPASDEPLPVLLVRYAAQNLYAPLRTVEALPGVTPKPTSLNKQITTLLPQQPVAATPLAAWKTDNTTVTAIRLQNRSGQRIDLDPRELQGQFIAAAHACYREKRQTLTEDIRNALFALARDASLPEARRQRAYEMAESINLFCVGFEGELFNRAGQMWPEADITLVDLATFAREGYEAQLAISYISLINHINNLGERDQHLARPIVNITDEAHIITVNPLLARFLTKGSKMWRKLGIWLWLATQNLADFPDEAKKLLNMIEWWELLVMPPEEIEQVCRFKALTEEQRKLLRSAVKSPGQYTEGVVLSPRVEGLFRVVPPALYLALAMTEKHEKAERMRIMRETGCSEVEAAMRVAGRNFIGC